MKQAPQQFSLALITGASSGIGEALCRLLADQGINLLITGRDQLRLEALAAALRDKVDVQLFTANLAIPSDRKIVLDRIYSQQPDLMINNAGFGLYGEALTYSTAEQMEIFEVNATALLELSLEAARTLASHQRKGTIVNVASVAAYYVMPYLAVYAASKSFVVQFSQALDLELEPYGVRMLASCPGMVSTGFVKRASGGSQTTQPSFSMSADFAAKEIWKQIQKGKAVHVFDWKSRWGTYFSKLVPKRLMAYILRSRIANRIPRRPIKVK